MGKCHEIGDSVQALNVIFSMVSEALHISFFGCVWLYFCHLHLGHVTWKLLLRLFRAVLVQDSKEH